MDKVGKAQSAQKDGLAFQQAIQGAQMERKTEANIQSVNEAQNMGDGTEKINDREDREQTPSQGGGKRQDKDEENPEEQEQFVIRDPRLGKNIDISL